MSDVAHRAPLDVLRDQLGVQLEAIERNEPKVRAGNDPDALHDFRVALRRSRALIRASRPLLRDRLALLDRELRWLGNATGPVRDSDVLIAHLRQLRPGLRGDRGGIDSLIAALASERDTQRAVLLAAIESLRYRGLLVRFRRAVAQLEAPEGPFDVGDAARKEFARLRDAYEALGPEGSDEALHAVRIKAKHARYAAEFAGRAEGGDFAQLAQRLAALQDAIGAHQDAVVAVERVRTLADARSSIAVGRIIELENERRRRARARVPGLWTRIERAAQTAFGQ